VDTRGQQPPPPAQQQTAPFLNTRGVRMLEITVQLPKASLVGGGGVSLTATGRFDIETGMMCESAFALRIHDFRLPTLIGVNSNERMAKQVVIANVEVDRLDDDADTYFELEQVLVKVKEELFPFSFFRRGVLLTWRFRRCPNPHLRHWKPLLRCLRQR
jgi:hypothetical protein